MRNSQDLYLYALQKVIKHPSHKVTDGRLNIKYYSDDIQFILPGKIEGISVGYVMNSKSSSTVDYIMSRKHIRKHQYHNSVYRYIELFPLRLWENQLVIHLKAHISAHFHPDGNEELLSELLPHESQAFFAASNQLSNKNKTQITIDSGTYTASFKYNCEQQSFELNLIGFRSSASGGG